MQKFNGVTNDTQVLQSSGCWPFLSRSTSNAYLCALHVRRAQWPPAARLALGPISSRRALCSARALGFWRCFCSRKAGAQIAFTLIFFVAEHPQRKPRKSRRLQCVRLRSRNRESCCFHLCARFFCTPGSRGRRGLLLRVFFSRSRRDDSARLVSDPRTCGDEKHQREWALVLGDAWNDVWCLLVGALGISERRSGRT